MPTRKKKTFNVSFQGVGSLPETVKVTEGTTVADFKTTYDLKGYIFSLNGKSNVKGSALLSKNDVIRIGAKTKNA